MKVLIILATILLLVLLYARLIEVKQLVIKKVELSKALGLKILHVSDLHFNKFYNTKRLDKLVTKLNRIDVDLIIFTGDLLDGPYIGSINGIAESLSKLNNKIPRIAVYGNHDYKSKYFKDVAGIYKDADIQLLVNSSQSLLIRDKALNIVGADDYLRGNRALERLTAVTKDDQYNLLLLHEPDLVERIDLNKFDLVLSGHTHGGQVRLPFNISGSTNYGKIYREGLFKLSDKTKLYVSSGVGNAGLNIRFRVKPSVTIISI